ncbi:MAG: hypothetical protein VB042_02940 [Victivallaceae bacterium]|nr:hypothetical protein [Victivallaceae bacterium]
MENVATPTAGTRIAGTAQLTFNISDRELSGYIFAVARKTGMSPQAVALELMRSGYRRAKIFYPQKG